MAYPKKRRRELPEMRRQAILNQLNQHGPQSARQISAALKYEQRTMAAYIREMRADGEIVVVREDRSRNVVLPIYEAKVTKTQVRKKKVVVAPEILSEVTRVLAPGHIEHLGTHRNRPLKDSGGQGRIGGGSGVISSLGGGPLFVKL